MSEQEAREVERALLHLADARTRTRQGADALQKAGATAHVVQAMREAEQGLAELHRTLSQGTYYAVPDDTLRLTI